MPPDDQPNPRSETARQFHQNIKLKRRGGGGGGLDSSTTTMVEIVWRSISTLTQEETDD